MSDPSDDPDLLAAEYVLGTLDADAARSAADRARLDEAFAARVQAWQNRLAPLAMLSDPVPPPAALWGRIAQSIAGAQPAGSIAGGQPAESIPSPNVVLLAWRNVTLWRGATLAAFALAASLAFLMLTNRPPSVVATLLPPTAGGTAIIVERPAPGALRFVASGPVVAGTGQDLELWALPQGATRPVSLGILSPGGREVRLALNVPTQLLVSREPAGGSPTGQPTGPVVYQGSVAALRD